MPRNLEKVEEKVSVAKTTVQKPAAVKNQNLISFGDEDEYGDEQPPIRRGIKSLHDSGTQQAGLSTQTAISEEQLNKMKERQQARLEAKQ